MKFNIRDLHKKKKRAIEHEKLIDFKKKRNEKIAANMSLAKENPEIYKHGVKWITDILEFRKSHRNDYFLNVQIPKLLEKYPELYKKDVLKSILVASVNPDLTIKKIDGMVNAFSKLSKEEQTDILRKSLVNVNKENYGYLLPKK